MFVQTQNTPNPNSLKFLPSKKVSNDDPFEITDKNKSDNELVKNILSINGVTGIFLAEDFLSVNKDEKTNWEDLKHIIISFINDYYASGNEIVIDSNKITSPETQLPEIEKKIIKILEKKIAQQLQEMVVILNLKNIIMELLQFNYREVAPDVLAQ